MIILSFLYMALIPLFVGASITLKRGIAELYVKGFALHFSLFSICYVICMYYFKCNDLNRLSVIFRIIVIPFLLFGIYRIVRERIFYRTLVVQLYRMVCSQRFLALLALGVIAFQVIRIGILQPYTTLDSKTYDPLVHDMTVHRVIYGNDELTGQSIFYQNPKMLLTSWYVYEAYIAITCDVHSLILTGTVLPIFLIIMSYMVYWMIADVVFSQNDKKWFFMLACAVVSELQTFGVDESVFRLIWPVWGKNISVNVACPMIAILLWEIANNKTLGKVNTIWLFVFSAVGVFCSAGGILAIPIEIGAICFVFTVFKRDARLLIPGFVALVPVAHQVLVYLLYLKGAFL